MKRALRVFICKSMHMQSKRVDTRSFSALFCGINQVLQDSEASHAILADDFTRGKIISDTDETLNSFDVRAYAASRNNFLDGNERNGSDDVHLMIAEERRARHKLQAQFQKQLSEMGGKMDAVTAAVGKMNEVLGKAFLCAPETPGVDASCRSQIWHGYRPQPSPREYDAAGKRTSQDHGSPPIPTPAEARSPVNGPVVEDSGRPAISTFKTTAVSAKLGYPSGISISQLGRDPHSSDDASRSVPPLGHHDDNLPEAEIVYILPKIDDILVSPPRTRNSAAHPVLHVQLPRTVSGLPVPLVRTPMHKLHTHLHKSTLTAAPCNAVRLNVRLCAAVCTASFDSLCVCRVWQASTAVSLD